MGRFQSQLHVLCEEARWDDLNEVLNALRLADNSIRHDTGYFDKSGNSPNDDEQLVKKNVIQQGLSIIEKNLTLREGPHQWTPLMIACVRAPPSAIETLVTFCPGSCEIPDRSGSLPLHFVSCWRRDANDAEVSSVVSALLQACPETITMQNQWGQTPLHCAFDSKECPGLETIKELLGLSQNTPIYAPDIQNCGKKESLDFLNSNESSMHNKDSKSIKNYHESWQIQMRSHVRKALSTPDAKSRLPLHIAAEKGVREEILRLVISLYPEAATTPTEKGDLPIHLLHYWATDTINSQGNGGLEGSLRAGRASRKAINAVGLGSITALLEPVAGFWATMGTYTAINNNMQAGLVRTILGTDVVGVKEDGQMKAISERDEDETVTDLLSEEGDSLTRSHSVSSKASTSASVSAARKAAAAAVAVAAVAAAEAACRLRGSRGMNLPIHIACEHGASHVILAALCEQYPEGVSTPRPINASHNNILQNVRVNGPKKSTPSESKTAVMYPIEIFESGRAGIEAATAAHMQKRHNANPKNTSLTNSTISSTSFSLSRLTSVLQSFVERSDLLFAYYPEAVPSQLDMNDTNASTPVPKLVEIMMDSVSSLGSVTSARSARMRTQRKRIMRLYRKDVDRLARLELLIRTEALDAAVEFSPTACRVWLWMCRFTNPGNEKDNYQGSIGRIITHLPQPALRKLSFITQPSSKKRSTNGIYHALYSSTSSGNSEDLDSPQELDDGQTIGQVVRLFNGRTIQEEAQIRAAAATMDDLLQETSWQYHLTKYLEGNDALNYSVICRRSRAAGVRFLPEVKMKETGRTWNLPSHESEEKSDKKLKRGPKNSKFWQDVDDLLIVPTCTHSVYITYFLEVSSSLYGSEQLLQNNASNIENKNGGLLVASAPIDENESSNNLTKGTRLEAVVQKRVANSRFNSSTTCEVRLIFKYDPGRKFSLFYYGPQAGGRLSISLVRARQLVHASNESGYTPLHVLLNSSIIHPQISLDKQVKTLLEARFGSAAPGDSVGDVPLHYALKCGVSERMLRALIAANPSSLVETDKERRTPLHAAFLLSKEDPPSVGIIKALLSTPGENATKLKDSAVRLPLHIAAERGANEAILRLLVEAYPDGCYRQNKDGDLPIHLLVRSGMATTETVDLLLNPIMHNETICRVPGSRGVDFPLHMAAEYQCSYKVLSTLLETYSEAAVKPRRRQNLDGTAGPPIHALDIFELWRSTVATQARSRFMNFKKKTETIRDTKVSLGISDLQFSAKEAAEFDIAMADFDLRSDLLFVYNPTLIPHTLTTLTVPYRKETKRIIRLQNLIRREAIQCAEGKKVKKTVPLSRMASLAWLFFCTFTNPDDPFDHYANSVAEILKGLSTSVVQVLADVTNLTSESLPNTPIWEYANPKCAALILGRIRFVGRYVLRDDGYPVHKSDSCLVIRAEDHGAVDSYKTVLSLFETEEMPDIDDLASVGGGSVTNVAPDSAINVFLKFAKHIGLNEIDAQEELTKLIEAQNPDEIDYSLDNNDGTDFDEKPTSADIHSKVGSLKSKDITLDAFRKFCDNHSIDDKGISNVIIKFMLHRCQFQREIAMRSKLHLPTADWPIVPILDNFDVDRIQEGQINNIIENDLQGGLDGQITFSKDDLYLLDVQEKNASIYNFSLYKYAVVMLGADKDLSDVFHHEELGILQIREYMKQIGVALKHLHERDVIHGDLKMANVVRFRKRLALIDLDSACSSKPETLSDRKLMGGSSHKFSSGVLPPEMIEKIDLRSDVQQLYQYENYWSNISDDSKDLKLLTPDDIQTITSVVRSLLAKSEAVKNMGSSANSLRVNMNEPLAGLEDPQEDWKDILSLALITISFDDLPECLSQCQSLDQFSKVWTRLQANHKLWEKVRPQISSDGNFAYVVKSFCDTDDPCDDRKLSSSLDISSLPYKLLKPSRKIDIWAFGVLLFSLCSGGSLFHISFDGGLKDATSYEKLYKWNKAMADKIMDEKIEDPLAQDLLLKLLVPETERLDTMSQVLQHPFFGPPSAIDAQRILERFEERQLIEEETVIINVMTNDSKQKMELAAEKFCKIVFEEEKIIVPTSFIVLPYELKWNVAKTCLEAPNDLQSIGVAVKIGKCLLDINVSTARLSYWLAMKKNLNKNNGTEFKTKMKTWLVRARNEKTETVAREIISEIKCPVEYIGICREMLEKGDNISNARAYIRDPMAAARSAIKQSCDLLVQLYSNELVYLVDEISGTAVIPTNPKSNGKNLTYPIRVDKNMNYLRHFFIPFMNITVMSQLAAGGLKSLSKLLGIPESYGIPDPWLTVKAGLVHTKENPASIAEFSVLQDVLRKQEKKATFKATSNGTAAGSLPTRVDKEYETGVQVEGEMNTLETFFRQYDPMRIFCELHRVCDGKDNSPGVWTTKEIVSRMQAEVELASMETRLRMLKKEYLKKKKLKEEIDALTNKVKSLQSVSFDCETPANTSDSTAETEVTDGTSEVDEFGNTYQATPTEENSQIAMEEMMNEVRKSTTDIDLTMKPEDFEDPFYSRLAYDPIKQYSSSSKTSDKRKKVRNTQKNKGKKGLRFKPYFGSC